MNDNKAQALLRSLYATGYPQTLAHAAVGDVVIVAHTDDDYDTKGEQWFGLVQVWGRNKSIVRCVAHGILEPMTSESNYIFLVTHKAVFLRVQKPID